MAKKKGSSEGKKRHYKAYAANKTYMKNKKIKLERHLKKFPNDEQAKEAIKNIRVDPPRKKPRSKVWSAPKREYAQNLAKTGYNGNIAIRKERKD